MDYRVLKYGFLICASIGSGLLLFSAMAPDVPFMHTMVVFCIILLPFIFIWKDLAREVLVAVLAFSLPFSIDQTLNLDPLHQGGAKGYIISASGIAVILLFILYFLELFENREKRLRLFNPASLFLFGLLGMCILSLANARDRVFSLYEILEFMKMVAIFIYVANYIYDRKKLRYILILLFAGLFLESSIAILQRVTGSTLNLTFLGGRQSTDIRNYSSTRMGGTLGGPNALAWYLDFILPFVLSFLFVKIPSRVRKLLFPCLVLGMIALVLTFSRGGWLGFLIGALVVGLFYLRTCPLRKKIFLVLLLILCGGASGIIIFDTDNPIQDRLTADDKGSAWVRVPLMRVAWNMIMANPVIGNGLNNYVLVYQNFDDTPEQVTSHFPYPVHNFFLQLTAEIGLPGILFFALYILYLFNIALRHIPETGDGDRAFFVGLVGSIAAGLSQGLVENSSIGGYSLLPFWFLGGVATGHSEKICEEQTEI
jgi:putative inorganic carbon (HCO3(-)) transporter